MQNVNLPAETLRALQSLGRQKVAVSWVGGKVEFRSAVEPPPHAIALLNAHEPAIVKLLRPNGDGRSALDLARERHRPFLEAMEDQRPSDVRDAEWEAAIDGLRVFLFSGQGEEALRLGWPHDELFDVPPLWSRVDLCGAALAIGDREVVEITPTEIRIKTASGATLGIYRKPSIDYHLAYETRLKSVGLDAVNAETQLRALEAVVNLYRSHHPDADIDTAKAAVLAAIRRAAP
jgi:hypothetical protein